MLLLIFMAACSKTKQERTFFLIGDSTMADKPFIDGNPERGWGQVFPLYLKDGNRVENHAVNGRSSKSFRNEGKWDVVLNRMKPGDYVIIQFGHNDQKIKDSSRYTDPNIEYRANLTRYIEDVRKWKGYPILATSIVRRRFDEKGQFYESHGEYPGVVREVANANNVPLLDLQASTKELLIDYGPENSKKLFLFINPNEYPSLPNGREDNTHLSSVGAFRICDLATTEIKAKVSELKEVFKE